MIAVGVETPRMEPAQMDTLVRAAPIWNGYAEEMWICIAPGRAHLLAGVDEQIKGTGTKLRIIPWIKVADFGRYRDLFRWPFWEKLRAECIEYIARGYRKIAFDFETAMSSAGGASLWDEPTTSAQSEEWEIGTQSLPTELAGVEGMTEFVMYPSHNYSRKDASRQANREARTKMIVAGNYDLVAAARCWKSPNDQWVEKWKARAGLFNGEICTQILYIALDDRPASEIAAMSPDERDSFTHWRDNGIPMNEIKPRIAVMHDDTRFAQDDFMIYPGYTNFVERSKRIVAQL